MLLGGMPPMVWSAPAASPQDLQQVQKAISGTQRQIQQTTATQKQVDASLTHTQNQLQQVQKQLATLAKQRGLSTAKLQQLQTQLEELKTRIGGAQTQVARLLNAHYRNRQPNAINLLLKNNSAQQKGRLLQYMRYVNQANEQVISRLRTQQQALAQQQQAIAQQQRQLTQLQAKQKNVLAQLGRQHAAQKNQSNQLDQQLDQQNAKLSTLKANERQLSNLISRLSAQAAVKRKAAANAHHQAQQKRQAQLAASTQAAKIPVAPPGKKNTRSTIPKSTPNAAKSTLTAEDMALQAPQIATEAPTELNGFARMQGQMRRPVSGRVAGQFGQAKPGGGTWKGLFFATPPASVQSIAPGEVIYAGALSGYGHTVIVDHGNGYVSVYAGLGGVAVHSGSHISARQGIGRSGSLPNGENGLYFEIRYHSQPMNPLSFIS